MLPFQVSEQHSLEMIQMRHAEECFRVVDRDRAHLRKWLPWVDACKESSDTEAFIRATTEQFARDGAFQCMILWKGAIVGTVGFHSVNTMNRASSIGYWLASSHTGKGIMTESCRILLNHAFGAMKLHRVEIRCCPDNVKSCAIPERLGFTREGTARDAELLNERYVDHSVYSMLTHEWCG